MKEATLQPGVVPCADCALLLTPERGELAGYRCPNCRAAVCFTCGCTDRNPCVRVVWNKAHTSSETTGCVWYMNPSTGQSMGTGLCDMCAHRAAYELYCRATEQPATDPYYMTGRSTQKGRNNP